ncbi:MAG TPA: retropepsin-like aspartic protease, partial [Candidatus Dormibacteraeota bacterium]|nr:retropepsin-like aspartic protease [Candidatus Dormibacteraeota bacterium]
MPARLLAACSLLAVATLAPPFRAAGTPSAAAIVPFAFVDNRMTIECTIDGRGPFVMIVDTGAPDVAITPEAAKKLGLAVRDAGTTSGAGNNRAQNGATTIPLLSIGSLHLRNLDSGVIDLTEIQRKLGFARLDGIVGYAVLKQFATFIDADARTITFSSSLPSVPSGATTTRFSGSTPVIPARIDGIDTTVIVDTGDRSSLTLFGPFAKMHGYY